jgi:hypothetical protein
VELAMQCNPNSGPCCSRRGEKHAPCPAGPTAPVAPWKCQLAMALTQAMFVIGSVYLKSRMLHVDRSKGEEFHPIVYAFIREVVAGPLLLLIAWFYVGEVPSVGCAASRLGGPGSLGDLLSSMATGTLDVTLLYL